MTTLFWDIFYLCERLFLLFLRYQLHLRIYRKNSYLPNFPGCYSGRSASLQVRLLNKNGLSKILRSCPKYIRSRVFFTLTVITYFRMKQLLITLFSTLISRLTITFSPVLLTAYHSFMSLFTLISHLQLSVCTRLNKSPYADSYWFLYSAKLTYYSERQL